MSGVVIARCNCKSEYQDLVYGPRMRVFNVGKTPDIRKCTVCDPITRMKKLATHAGMHKKDVHG
jgi:tRNA U34 2-thiouridine synthase MnmA/TrmU